MTITAIAHNLLSSVGECWPLSQWSRVRFSVGDVDYPYVPYRFVSVFGQIIAHTHNETMKQKVVTFQLVTFLHPYHNRILTNHIHKRTHKWYTNTSNVSSWSSSLRSRPTSSTSAVVARPALKRSPTHPHTTPPTPHNLPTSPADADPRIACATTHRHGHHHHTLVLQTQRH